MSITLIAKLILYTLDKKLIEPWILSLKQKYIQLIAIYIK